MAGYNKRINVTMTIEQKKKELMRLTDDMPSAAKILLHQKNGQQQNSEGGNKNNISDSADLLRTEAELHVDQYFKTKEEVQRLEERHTILQTKAETITFKDIDSVMRERGTIMPKRQIDHMIWEVDERLDEVIDFDEFQLTYYRNINDTSGNEPSMFFRLMEFMIFDAANKGYIIEDDCMEILYGRYGGGNLEKELKLLFGQKLRAEGGDGTLSLEAYLQSCTARTGRRALVT
mmetsp:Transcript_27723/g.38200  ORF Transcript_27723/g.38200 Transcript_27723/m.38200 type:complete len:233 (+) Transcript_27723:110-808(+)